MKLFTAVAAGILIAAQTLPAAANDDATERRAARFADSASLSSAGYTLSTSGSAKAMPGHISDDAEARRAGRFADNASSATAFRLSTSGASMTSGHIDDDAEARRAARFN